MTVSAPFFPRYMFVALDLGRGRWRLAETLAVGERVQILNGRFASGGRVQVSLLGGSVRVGIDRHSLMPAVAA
jgi:hypothetical protein